MHHPAIAHMQHALPYTATCVDAYPRGSPVPSGSPNQIYPTQPKAHLLVERSYRASTNSRRDHDGFFDHGFQALDYNKVWLADNHPDNSTIPPRIADG